MILQDVALCCIMDKSPEMGNIAMKEEYYTVEQVARKIHLSEYRIRQLIREKQIRATKIKQWRILPQDLEEFIKARTNR